MEQISIETVKKYTDKLDVTKAKLEDTEWALKEATRLLEVAARNMNLLDSFSQDYKYYEIQGYWKDYANACSMLAEATNKISENL